MDLKFYTYLKNHIKEIPLTERERAILIYRFGTEDSNLHTLEETGDHFGVSRQRVNQIELKAKERYNELTKT